jgi:hypothetical protein
MLLSFEPAHAVNVKDKISITIMLFMSRFASSSVSYYFFVVNENFKNPVKKPAAAPTLYNSPDLTFSILSPSVIQDPRKVHENSRPAMEPTTAPSSIFMIRVPTKVAVVAKQTPIKTGQLS